MSGSPSSGDDVTCRPRRAEDDAAVDAVLTGSFAEEAPRIIEVLARLRAVGDLRAEVVAEAGGEVVGTVALSRAWLDARERLVDVLVLSPLGVLPSAQGRGVGTALLAAVPDVAAELGEPLVFLEGSPGYYSARGWAPASSHGLERPSLRIPEPACQVLLLPSYEPWMTGRLVYPDVWWRLDLVGLRDPLLAQVEGG
jgi:putative acetyltransferase